MKKPHKQNTKTTTKRKVFWIFDTNVRFISSLLWDPHTFPINLNFNRRHTLSLLQSRSPSLPLSPPWTTKPTMSSASARLDRLSYLSLPSLLPILGASPAASSSQAAPWPRLDASPGSPSRVGSSTPMRLARLEPSRAACSPRKPWPGTYSAPSRDSSSSPWSASPSPSLRRTPRFRGSENPSNLGFVLIKVRHL